MNLPIKRLFIGDDQIHSMEPLPGIIRIPIFHSILLDALHDAFYTLYSDINCFCILRKHKYKENTKEILEIQFLNPKSRIQYFEMKKSMSDITHPSYELYEIFNQRSHYDCIYIINDPKDKECYLIGGMDREATFHMKGATMKTKINSCIRFVRKFYAERFA